MWKQADLAAKTPAELVGLVLDLQGKVSDLAAMIEKERNGAPERVTYSREPIRRPDGRGGHRPGWWTRTFSRVPLLDANGTPTGKYRTTAGWKLLRAEGAAEATEDREAAARLLKRLGRAPAAAPKGGPKVAYLRTLVEDYIAAKKAADKVTPEREKRLRAVAALLVPEGAGDVLLEKISEDDIKRAVRKSAPGAPLMPSARMFRFQILKAIFNFAVKKKLLKVSPSAALSPDDVNAGVTMRSPIKVKAEDRERIVRAAYARSEDLGAILDFLRLTGWRPIMACRLTFANIDLKTGEIRVTRSITKKGRGERVTKVSAAALAILQKRAALARLDGCGDEDAFRAHLVFTRKGKAASARWFAERFNRIVKTLKIRGQFGEVPTLYALRKGFAQDMEAAGATAYAKQAALCDVSGGSIIDQSTRDTMAAMGHSDPSMVSRHYADGVEALDVVLKKLPGGSA